jgi:Spy/CpxP family protein refolding chaperone
MSFISSTTSSLASSLYATVATTTSNSLRPFANLNLTEAQRTQIRSIFQQAKSQGLSQSQIQQEINAVLTPDQQAQLQTDIQQFQSQQSSSSSQQQGPPNPFADPNGPFANLNLSSSQQSQIASILQSARSQGLSPSQINSQISAVLTTSQQSTFQTDLQNLPSPPQGGPGAQQGGDPLSNLSLTSSQKTQIDQILQQVQSGTITQSQALAQITSLLTPAQQTALQQDEQTAQTQVSGHRRHHGSGDGSASTSSSTTTTSVATLPSGVTETDIQNQVAAATSVILNQLQHEVATA